jgi:hypothetical protein
MFLKSVVHRIRCLDLYKQVPKELSESTYSGALISLLSMLIISALVLSELKVYLNHHHVTDMEVNQSHPDDFVLIEMQILLNKVILIV